MLVDANKAEHSSVLGLQFIRVKKLITSVWMGKKCRSTFHFKMETNLLLSLKHRLEM